MRLEKLNSTIAKTIARCGAAAYPAETCGVLIGPSGAAGVRILDAIGLPNLWKSAAKDRYEIDPRAYAAVEKKLAGKRQRVVGFFHSHPDGLSEPSAADLEAARGLYEVTRTSYVYAILRVSDGRAGALTFWRLADDQSKFVRVRA
jgi:proteasome lid subunit RPN8/RPN11